MRWCFPGELTIQLLTHDRRSGFSLTAALLKSNGTSLNFRPVYVADEASHDSVRPFDNILLLTGFDHWGLQMNLGGC